MSIKCFYHSQDLDGWASGAIVKHKFPEVEMFPINYGDEFPWDEINKNDIIYMVDFSLKADEMDRLNNFVDQNLIWIDHHIGAIRDYENHPMRYLAILGVRDSSVAACELTWNYLFPNKKVPSHVRLLSLYDTWKHNDKEFDWNFIEAFEYGFKNISFDPKDPEGWQSFNSGWKRFFDIADYIALLADYVINIAKDGKNIQHYIESRFESELKSRSFVVEWEGYRCLIVNSDSHVVNYITRSSLFSGRDVAINFNNVQNKYWVVNLRAVRDDIDLSELTKKYGGGGHKSAAGFTWRAKELPWDCELPK